jgi:hypothetical protein
MFDSLFFSCFSPRLLRVELVFKITFGVYISMYSPVLAATSNTRELGRYQISSNHYGL